MNYYWSLSALAITLKNDPDAIRTHNLLIRSQTPYPLGHGAPFVELIASANYFPYKSRAYILVLNKIMGV